MREILFRGKRIDNGEWVEGYYIPIEERAHIVLEADTMCMDAECADFFAVEWYQVDPETVCQYTGLTDKNGVKIFEGDVVKSYNLYGKYDGKGIVHWSDLFSSCQFGECRVLLKLCKYEVIDNIFDNPELVKGGEADETD